ncbi:MAG: hypothetical protein WD873_01655, partial [Candidatus Hydrogenedentales bacterium]
MAQRRRCGMMPYHNHLAETAIGYPIERRNIELNRFDARRTLRSRVIRIPVVVHIVYYSKSQNVTDQQVAEQISVLNEDFRARNSDLDKVPEVFRDLVADSMIEFQLARRDPLGNPTNGINRKKTKTRRFPKSTVPADEDDTAYID